MKTTKELARELGFLRKRSFSNTLHVRPGDAKNTNHSNQFFSYLIVLDFESTCWNDCKYKTQEIIEFPCVLLNTRTGVIESEFQHYIQPCEHPVLSDFCKQLTGITQEQVEQGIPVSLCLRKFQHWVNRLQEEKGITFSVTDNRAASGLTTIVTWSDWDLGVCLQYECRRKQISKPPHFNSWIDLRATYRKFYNRKPQGLNGALQDVGIEFEGREHSGLCDARNTARLAWRMIKDGCILLITKTIKPSPSERPEMVPLSKDTENMIPKQKRSVPVASKPNSISPAVNQSDTVKNTKPSVQLKRSLPVNRSSDCKMETLKAKICCIRSPKKDSICCNESNPVQSSCISVCVQTSAVKPGLSMRSNNMSTVSLGENILVIKQFTSAVVSKSVTSIISPGLQTPLQRSQETTNIQNHSSIPIFKSPSYVNKLAVNQSSSTTPHSVSNSSEKKCTFKTPSTTTIPLVNKFCSTTPQNMLITSAKKCTFKTPRATTTPLVNKPGYTTPHIITSAMKCTPPLCKCGRRAKRRLVQSPGPNVGRFFFSCGQGRSGDRNSGCGFFQWENESVSKGRQLSRRCGSLGKPYTPVLNMNKQSWNSSTLILSKRQHGIVHSSQNTKCLR